MSAFSGAAQSRMSQDTTVTWSPHSSKRQFSNLCKYESGQKSDLKMLNWPFTPVPHFPQGCIVKIHTFTFQMYQHPPSHEEQQRRCAPLTWWQRWDFSPQRTPSASCPPFWQHVARRWPADPDPLPEPSAPCQTQSEKFQNSLSHFHSSYCWFLLHMITLPRLEEILLLVVCLPYFTWTFVYNYSLYVCFFLLLWHSVKQTFIHSL